jgi:hypothetical protein
VAPHWPRGVHGRHDSPHGFPLGARGWGIMPSTPTISLASVVFPCQVRTVDSHAVWMIGGYRLDKAGERFTREGQRASSRPSIRPLAKSTASHRYLAAVVLALVGTHQLHEFAFAAVLHLPRSNGSRSVTSTSHRIPSPPVRNSQDLWIGVSRDLLITTL